MAKRTKILVSKTKKRILSAAGIFAAGSILGASITEPPDKTPNRSYSLLDNEIVETQGVASEETTGNSENDDEFIQSIMKSKETTEKIEEPTVAEVPVSDTILDTETEIVVDEIPESAAETVTNWFEFEKDGSEETTPETFTVDGTKDWFEESPEEDIEILPELPAVDSDWMSGQEKSSIETEPSVVTLGETSSMTSELVAQLEGIAFFWAPSGEKIHVDPTCRSFKKGITYAGTLEEATSVRSGGWCGICSKNVDTTYNFYATREILEACYTYNDFLSGIPSDAFHNR